MASRLSGDFIRRIAHALQEEEVDVYVLTLYCLSADDLNYFNEEDREKIRKIFRVLVEDTRRHMELLKLIVELGTT